MALSLWWTALLAYVVVTAQAQDPTLSPPGIVNHLEWYYENNYQDVIGGYQNSQAGPFAASVLATLQSFKINVSEVTLTLKSSAVVPRKIEVDAVFSDPMLVFSVAELLDVDQLLNTFNGQLFRAIPLFTAPLTSKDYIVFPDLSFPSTVLSLAHGAEILAGAVNAALVARGLQTDLVNLEAQPSATGDNSTAILLSCLVENNATLASIMGSVGASPLTITFNAKTYTSRAAAPANPSLSWWYDADYYTVVGDYHMMMEEAFASTVRQTLSNLGINPSNINLVPVSSPYAPRKIQIDALFDNAATRDAVALAVNNGNLVSTYRTVTYTALPMSAAPPIASLYVVFPTLSYQNTLLWIPHGTEVFAFAVNDSLALRNLHAETMNIAALAALPSGGTQAWLTTVVPNKFNLILVNNSVLATPLTITFNGTQYTSLSGPTTTTVSTTPATSTVSSTPVPSIPSLSWWYDADYYTVVGDYRMMEEEAFASTIRQAMNNLGINPSNINLVPVSSPYAPRKIQVNALFENAASRDAVDLAIAAGNLVSTYRTIVYTALPMGQAPAIASLYVVFPTLSYQNTLMLIPHGTEVFAFAVNDSLAVRTLHSDTMNIAALEDLPSGGTQAWLTSTVANKFNLILVNNSVLATPLTITFNGTQYTSAHTTTTTTTTTPTTVSTPAPEPATIDLSWWYDADYYTVVGDYHMMEEEAFASTIRQTMSDLGINPSNINLVPVSSPYAPRKIQINALFDTVNHRDFVTQAILQGSLVSTFRKVQYTALPLSAAPAIRSYYIVFPTLSYQNTLLWLPHGTEVFSFAVNDSLALRSLHSETMNIAALEDSLSGGTQAWLTTVVPNQFNLVLVNQSVSLTALTITFNGTQYTSHVVTTTTVAPATTTTPPAPTEPAVIPLSWWYNADYYTVVGDYHMMEEEAFASTVRQAMSNVGINPANINLAPVSSPYAPRKIQINALFETVASRDAVTQALVQGTLISTFRQIQYMARPMSAAPSIASLYIYFPTLSYQNTLLWLPHGTEVFAFAVNDSLAVRTLHSEVMNIATQELLPSGGTQAWLTTELAFKFNLILVNNSILSTPLTITFNGTQYTSQMVTTTTSTAAPSTLAPTTAPSAPVNINFSWWYDADYLAVVGDYHMMEEEAFASTVRQAMFDVLGISPGNINLVPHSSSLAPRKIQVDALFDTINHRDLVQQAVLAGTLVSTFRKVQFTALPLSAAPAIRSLLVYFPSLPFSDGVLTVPHGPDVFAAAVNTSLATRSLSADVVNIAGVADPATGVTVAWLTTIVPNYFNLQLINNSVRATPLTITFNGMQYTSHQLVPTTTAVPTTATAASPTTPVSGPTTLSWWYNASFFAVIGDYHLMQEEAFVSTVRQAMSNLGVNPANINLVSASSPYAPRKIQINAMFDSVVNRDTIARAVNNGTLVSTYRAVTFTALPMSAAPAIVGLHIVFPTLAFTTAVLTQPHGADQLALDVNASLIALGINTRKINLFARQWDAADMADVWVTSVASDSVGVSALNLIRTYSTTLRVTFFGQTYTAGTPPTRPTTRSTTPAAVASTSASAGDVTSTQAAGPASSTVPAPTVTTPRPASTARRTTPTRATTLTPTSAASSTQSGSKSNSTVFIVIGVGIAVACVIVGAVLVYLLR